MDAPFAAPADLRARAQRRFDPSRAGGAEWRNTSEAIWQYLREDTRDAREQRREWYPTNHVEHIPRLTPFIPWLANQHGTAYVHDPALELRSLDGPRLDAEEVQRYRMHRDAAGVNEAFHEANRQMVTCGNGVVLFQPGAVELEAGPSSGVVALAVPAHDCAVGMGPRAWSSAERDVEVLWVRLPLPGSQRSASGLVAYGVARITATTAVWEVADGDLEGRGLWFEDRSNPFGEIPFVALRFSAPAAGEFWAPARTALLYTQRAIDHDYTDVGHTARKQGWGYPWAKGLPPGTKIRLSHEEVLGLGSDEKAAFGFAATNAPIDQVLSQLESYVRTAAASVDANPANLFRNTTLTAVAKQIEMNDRQEARARHQRELRRGEQRGYRLMRVGLERLWGVPVLPPASLRLHYRIPAMPADTLHEAQAQDLRCKNGTSSPVRELMRTNALTFEEARELALEIRAENDEFGPREPAPKPPPEAPQPPKSEPQLEGAKVDAGGGE